MVKINGNSIADLRKTADEPSSGGASASACGAEASALPPSQPEEPAIDATANPAESGSDTAVKVGESAVDLPTQPDEKEVKPSPQAVEAKADEPAPVTEKTAEETQPTADGKPIAARELELDDARRQVRERTLERERKRQSRIVKEKGQRRNRRRAVVLALLVLASSAVAAFSMGGNQAAGADLPAEYTLASLDNVIDTTSVNGQIVPVEVSNDGFEIIDYESEVNQFLSEDGGFVLNDGPQDSDSFSPDATDLPLPEEPEHTPVPTPISVTGYAVISVDGAIVASLNSGEDAQWLVDKLIEVYDKPLSGGTITARGFVQDVEILSQDEKPQNIIGREEAYLLLKDTLSVEVSEEQRVEEAIKYGTKYVDDATMNQGLKKTTQEGKNGKQQSVYTVTYVNGKQQSRKLTAKKVLAEPVTAIVTVGTKPVVSAVPVNGSYAPGKVPLGADYPNIDKTRDKPTPNEGIMGPSSGSLHFMYPVSGSISSYFGWRWGRMHYGIDLPHPTGTPAKASEGGVVTSYTGVHTGYGNIVEISHGAGFTTRYAHLDKIMVTVGQRVNKGDVIGLIGTSGTQTSGPHLHFEIRNTGTPYNPLFYLDK